MFANKRFLQAMFFGVLVAFSTASLAASASNASAKNAKASSSEMTPELKMDMANMYQKMSDCMKTDQTLDQCQKATMKDCPVVAKTGHCPLMEGTRPMMKRMQMKGMPMMDKEKSSMGKGSMGSESMGK
jgi:gas vesicle protein